MKNKEQEVEKEIFRVLSEYESLRYNELYYKIKRFGTVTINKYLKKMVSENTVKHEKNRYLIDPNLKEILKTWEEQKEYMLSSLAREIEELDAYLYLYWESIKNSKDPMKMRKSFSKSLSKDVIRWYKSYCVGMYIVSSGVLPTSIEKETRRICEFQLKQISNLFKNVKDADPILHILLLGNTVDRIKFH